MNVDSILIFVAGMIVGGFLYVRAEGVILSRFYPDHEGEGRLVALRKIGFGCTFAGVFLLILAYYYTQNALLSGICAGFAIFGFKP